MKKEHTVPIQIRFNDIDLAGHVYNAKYQEFFDLARVKYFEDVLGSLINWTDNSLIIASVKVDYIQSIFLKDKIKVETHVTLLGEKSFEMTQWTFKNELAEPVAVGKTIMVCFDMTTRASKVIPLEWREKFMEFEPGLNLDQSIRKV